MAIEIITPRLRLRRFEARDVDRVHALAGDWAVARMTTDIPHPLSRDEAASWVKTGRGDQRFAVLEGVSADRQLIGSVGYWRRHDGLDELGFWIAPSCWGRGLATEAARGLIADGFNSGRVSAFSTSHFIDNTQSRRVIEKLGFTRLGSVRMLSPARGGEVEAATYTLDRATAFDLGLANAVQPARAPWRRIVGLVTGS